MPKRKKQIGKDVVKRIEKKKIKSEEKWFLKLPAAKSWGKKK
jgi:hypothetical protein